MGSSSPPPEQFETARLRLSRLTTAHASAIFEGWAQDREVTRYLHWLPHEDEAESVAHAERCEASWASGKSFTWILEELDSGRIVGSIAAHDSGFRVGLGYVIARESWGRGYAPEAVQAVADWFLNRSGTHRVWAVCDVDNTASARVLEKSGFELEGTLRRWVMHPNVSDQPREHSASASLVTQVREGGSVWRLTSVNTGTPAQGAGGALRPNRPARGV